MRIKSIEFSNHEILRNLKIDFCDIDGKPVDTIIIAGENGVGKSALLNAIYGIATYKLDKQWLPIIVCYEYNDTDINLTFDIGNNDRIAVTSTKLKMNNIPIDLMDAQNKIHFKAIFSDVDINFQSDQIKTVTSMDIDSDSANSARSNSSLPKTIQQLLIDIQTLDDSSLAQAVREQYLAGARGDSFIVSPDMLLGRTARFKDAFSFMFDDLEYFGVENVVDHKEIIFKRADMKIPLSALSSGEKQIVYRASFLLKDKHSLNSAFVLIDEPEISMHPEWQKKILEFYKRLFIDSNGKQTSQIFAVTHSPFIIHNDLRKNDKVIVLSRDEQGQVIVLDKPEYYSCHSIEAIKDAFSEDWHHYGEHSIYTEGRTDSMYLKKAVEVFGYLEFPFTIRWIGHIDSSGQECFTGKESLDRAYQFCKPQNNRFKQVFLYDCDVRQIAEDHDMIHKRIIATFENMRFKKGIENALSLSHLDIKWELYYSRKEKVDDYGAKKEIEEFDKMKFCEYICSLSAESLKVVFKNLEPVIAEISSLIEA